MTIFVNLKVAVILFFNTSSSVLLVVNIKGAYCR